MIGQTISHYRVTAKIGEGGMGEVYRATDSKLNREVALKVLPPQFAQDGQRMARFAREAQVLASLNHPNIAAIYGLEEMTGSASSGSSNSDSASGAQQGIPSTQDPTPSTHSKCLVLELVEGPTLEERIASGPLPLEQALRIAIQIIEALECAHEKGIIHRDLKPANVKLTPAGTVKVLDFGLAKALEGDVAESPDASNSPTLTMAATQAGIIMGTAAYMSPEQASAGSADRRSDIWSFGVILFELLSGKQLFSGQTVSHTLAEVLKTEPNWGELSDDVPSKIRHLLGRCLRKDPRKRLQAIGDARIEIEEFLENPVEDIQPQTEVANPRGRWKWLLPIAAILAFVSFGLGWVLDSPWAASPEPIRLSVELTGGGLMTDYGTSSVISPDGNRIVYVEGVWPNTELYVRELDQFDPKPLPGTEGGYQPFFSPDGEWIGFVTRTALKKVPVIGGASMTLCDLLRSRGATWSRDGRIIFAAGPNSGLSWIPEAGGEPQPLTELDEEKGEYTHRWPQILPGERFVLFTTHTGSSNFDDASIEFMDLESGERKVVHRGGSQGQYLTSGHLVYVRQGTLFASAFDLDAMTVTGIPAPVLEGVSANPQQHGSAQFSVSDEGEIIYLSGPSGTSQVGLFSADLAGNQTALSNQTGIYYDPAYSPDGKKVALASETQGNVDIWVLDVERDSYTRLTFDSRRERYPVWTPDGKEIIFAQDNGQTDALLIRSADGSGEIRNLIDEEADQYPGDISPDGKFLLVGVIRNGVEGDDNAGDIVVLNIDSGEMVDLVAGPFAEFSPSFSPDGRWVAYSSIESGRPEVYVQRFEGAGRWQVSTLGGLYPKWSPDGKAIYYGFQGSLYKAEITARESSLEIGNPTMVNDTGVILDFDPHPSGETILFRRYGGVDGTSAQTHGRMIFNWFNDLKRIVPTD
ncbi:MAG: protein kinase [Acidobacteriota bacterium]|nr:MAG: protein kinase [Acidobacteriota bacterium]